MNGSSAIVLKRIHALGRISDERGSLTRRYGSEAMRRANALVATWMRTAGMALRRDNIGNLLGTYRCQTRNSKSLLLGSHLDTVRNAGKFDGPLGVLIAIAVVEKLNAKKLRLPFNLEVAAFCDEEGVRFQST